MSQNYYHEGHEVHEVIYIPTQFEKEPFLVHLHFLSISNAQFFCSG